MQKSLCHEGFVPWKQLKDLSMPSARGSTDVLRAGALAAHTVLRQPGLHHFTSQQNEMAPVKPFAVGSPFLYWENKCSIWNLGMWQAEKKEKIQYLSFGPSLTTCKPRQGRRKGQEPVSNGGEDTHCWMERMRHVKCHPAWPIQYPHCCWRPSWACGLNSAITKAWHYTDTQISISIIDFSKFSSEPITVI